MPNSEHRGLRAELIEILRLTAPGTYLRDGLDSVLRAGTGGLIVVSNGDKVSALFKGGFVIDAPYSPAHLYELAKMDGAIILSNDGQRIVSANVHLNPDPATPSSETGIRHRTAEQTARQTGALVICISQRRGMITLYSGSQKYVLRDISVLLTTANQAVQTLEKYQIALNDAMLRLSVEEFDNLVNLTDVIQVIQRVERLNRVNEELTTYITELGVESRLIKMQADELIGSLENDERLTLRDYQVRDESMTAKEQTEHIMQQLSDCTHEDLMDINFLAKVLGYANFDDKAKWEVLASRGYRLLHKIPRLPGHVIDNVVEHMGDFNTLLLATVEELDEVDGVGKVRARQISSGLERLRAQIISDSHWA